MRDLLSGLVVLGIGVFTGSSMLRGNFSLLAILFDAFGLVFIARGLHGLYKARVR